MHNKPAKIPRKLVALCPRQQDLLTTRTFLKMLIQVCNHTHFNNENHPKRRLFRIRKLKLFVMMVMMLLTAIKTMVMDVMMMVKIVIVCIEVQGYKPQWC
jgi:hypothetical protein